MSEGLLAQSAAVQLLCAVVRRGMTLRRFQATPGTERKRGSPRRAALTPYKYDWRLPYCVTQSPNTPKPAKKRRNVLYAGFTGGEI